MGKISYVSTPKLNDYKKQFAEHLIMERKNGILQVRMHTNGGPFKWCFQAHQALEEAWSVIGHDRENELLILTSTDPYWVGKFDCEAFGETEANYTPDTHYDALYRGCTKLVENFIFDIDIPTIAAINGPGLHWEFALLSNVTLCTPDFVLRDDHFKGGVVPGDGMSLCLQGLLGIKRAASMMYTLKSIDAKTCLDWGVVNEVIPRDKLLGRAWGIAEEIMKQPRVVRRLTSQLLRRPWKRLLVDDFQVHVGHEMYGYALLDTRHPNIFPAIEETFRAEAEAGQDSQDQESP
jgi:enoyl-CoA hydratase/carnithine racemase